MSAVFTPFVGAPSDYPLMAAEIGRSLGASMGLVVDEWRGVAGRLRSPAGASPSVA